MGILGTAQSSGFAQTTVANTSILPSNYFGTSMESDRNSPNQATRGRTMGADSHPKSQHNAGGPRPRRGALGLT